MAAQKFSKGEALRFGWNTMKSNIGFFIVVLIAVGLIQNVPNYIAVLAAMFSPVLSGIIVIASIFINIVVTMGLIKIFLRFSGNEKAEYADLFRSYKMFIKYILASGLFGLIVIGVMSLSIIPLVLLSLFDIYFGFMITTLMMMILAVPGSILGVKFHLFIYPIIDRGSGPIEALKESYRITTGAFWNLVLFGLIMACINILGMIPLGIGLFATVPTSMVAHAFIYRKLLGQEAVSTMPEPSAGPSDKTDLDKSIPLEQAIYHYRAKDFSRLVEERKKGE